MTIQEANKNANDLADELNKVVNKFNLPNCKFYVHEEEVEFKDLFIANIRVRVDDGACGIDSAEGFAIAEFHASLGLPSKDEAIKIAETTMKLVKPMFNANVYEVRIYDPGCSNYINVMIKHRSLDSIVIHTENIYYKKEANNENS